MYKVANQVIDFLDEKIAGNLDMGEFTYTAPETDDDYALLIKTASNILKKFPVNDKNNTAFSYASYLKNADILTPEMRKIAETNIAKRLDFYGLEHNLEKSDVKGNKYTLKPKDELEEKRADAPDEFAFGDKLPINNVNNLTKSANEFIKQKHLLSVNDKKMVAGNLVKKASELKVNIPSDIYQYASMTPSQLGNIKVAMATRFINYPIQIKEFVNGLLTKIKTADDAVKVAEAVDQIDTKLKLKKSLHLDPAKEFFTTEKTAEELEMEKLQRAIESDVLQDYLDEDSMETLKTAGFSKLSEPEQVIVKKILKNIN